MEERDVITILKEQEGVRLDALLASYYPELSRSYFQYLIEEGAVLVNGSQVKKRTKPTCDDEIEVCFLLTPEIDLKPEAIPLDILYEDEHLLAINKPAGMVVHPAPGHASGTFVNALLYHCHSLPQHAGDLRPGIVHRLDKETTGVLLAAKTVMAHQGLVSLFARRAIKKKYLALCAGVPKNQTIEAPIGRHPVHRKEMCIDHERGKEALTRIEVVAHQGDFSLVEVDLLTGRTHQIRVHMKSIGFPVLGDPVYGAPSINKKLGLTRQLLHAHTLRLTHPISQRTLELSAPLPEEMQHCLNKLRIGQNTNPSVL